MTLTATAPGRLERRKARTRAAILEAGSALFKRHGYEDTAIQQIAERADVGVGTLYGYFDSKEAILRAVVGLLTEQAITHYRDAVDEATPAVDKLRAALDAVASFISDNRGILLAALQIGSRTRQSEGEPMDWLLEAFKALISAGIREGSLVDLPVDSAVRMLLGTYLLAMLGMGIWHGRERDPQTRADLEALTLRLIEPKR